MELKVKRRWYSAVSTIGELWINGTFFCHTLEDTCRDGNRDGDLADAGEAKVFGKTCIPAGRYEVIINQSNRFKKLMPLLLNVTGYIGIRIHFGNKAIHTDGCLLVGRYDAKTPDFVGHSVDTFERMMIRLKAISKSEKIFITIEDLPAA